MKITTFLGLTLIFASTHSEPFQRCEEDGWTCNPEKGEIVLDCHEAMVSDFCKIHLSIEDELPSSFSTDIVMIIRNCFRIAIIPKGSKTRYFSDDSDESLLIKPASTQKNKIDTLIVENVRIVEFDIPDSYPRSIIMTNVRNVTFTYQVTTMLALLHGSNRVRDLQSNVKRLELTNVTINLIETGAINMNQTESVIFKNVQVNEIEEYGITIQGDNSYVEIAGSNFSNLDPVAMRVIVKKVNISNNVLNTTYYFLRGMRFTASDSIVFTDNIVNKWNVLLSAPVIHIENNTIQEMGKYALHSSTNDDSPQTRTTTFTFVNNTIQTLVVASLDFDWDTTSTHDHITFRGNQINCTCRNIDWFHSFLSATKFPYHSGLTARQTVFYKSLLDQTDNTCLNYPECTWLDAVLGYAHLCDVTPPQCFSSGPGVLLELQNTNQLLNPNYTGLAVDIGQRLLSTNTKILGLLQDISSTLSESVVNKQLETLSSSVQRVMDKNASADFHPILKDFLVQNQQMAMTNAKALDMLRSLSVAGNAEPLNTNTGPGTTHVQATLLPEWFLVVLVMVLVLGLVYVVVRNFGPHLRRKFIPIREFSDSAEMHASLNASPNSV